MATETIPVRGSEVIVLNASPGIILTIEEAAEDRIIVRLGPKSSGNAPEKTALLAYGAPEEFIQFACRLGILEHLVTAMRVAHGSFPSAEAWAFLTHTDAEQVEINVTVKGAVADIYRQHSACAEEWVKLLPPEALGKIALTESLM